MQLTLLPTGRLLVQDQHGYMHEIGAEHPDFQRLWVQYHQPAKPNTLPARLFGLAMMLLGIAGWWYNWHLAATQGEFAWALEPSVAPQDVAGCLIENLMAEMASAPTIRSYPQPTFSRASRTIRLPHPE